MISGGTFIDLNKFEDPSAPSSYFDPYVLDLTILELLQILAGHFSEDVNAGIARPVLCFVVFMRC